MSASSLRGALRRRTAPIVRALHPAELDKLLVPAFAIYTQAMGYPPAFTAPRLALARDQIRLPGATAVGAFERRRLIGFGYGYRSVPGQWWHDEVAVGLSAHPDHDAWLGDAFELCELHVSPIRQGAGLGRLMLHSLLHRAPTATVLLSTPNPGPGPTPAIALYESAGFQHLITDHRFAGDPRAFTIMGLRRGADATGSGPAAGRHR